MINKIFCAILPSPSGVSPLRGRLYGFWGPGQRCNSLEWGALERRTRGPAQRGSGSAGDAATAFHGARIPLRGRTFLRKALLLPSRSRLGASHEGLREAGIGQRKGCRDSVHGARIPLRGHTFLRKALFRPTRLHHLEVFFIDLVFLRFLHII
jgi:hypothetical protein